MANLPQSVQRQVEAADALLAEANQQGASLPQEPAATDLSAGAGTQVQPPQETAQPPAHTSSASSQDANWEHKFRTLQGIFHAEVPKLQQQNKELQSRLQDAIERMEKLAQQPRPQETAQPPAANSKDVESFGQDLVEMVQRQAQGAFSVIAKHMDATVSSLEKRIANLESALKGTAQTVSTTAEEVFFSKLAALVPDWEQVNTDTRFLAWLGEVDPVYGQPRQAALSAAHSAMDVSRVVSVFKAFKDTLPKQTPPKADPLAKQVSPKGSASAPPVPVDKPTITQQQVRNFYHEVATGKYRGRDAEMQRAEQMINEALAEGRIQ